MKTDVLRISAIFAAAITLIASCHETPEGKDPVTPAEPGKATIEVTVPTEALTINSAAARIKTKHVTHLAYILKTAAESYDTTPALMFEDGEIFICNAKGDTTLVFTELEALTDYALYVAGRDTTGNIMDTLISVPFRTPDYTEFATVTRRTYDGVELYVQVPAWTATDSSVVRYGISSLPMWNTLKLVQEWATPDILLWNGQRWLRESGKVVYNGDNEYELDENGEIVYDEYGEPVVIHDPIVPGEPLVFTAGEFVWNSEGDPMFGLDAGWITPKFDMEAWEAAGYPVDETEDSFWTGNFAKIQTSALAPEKLDAKLNVTISNITPANATISIAPDKSVYQYCLLAMDQDLYDMVMIMLDNNEDYLQWFTTSYFAAMQIGVPVLQEPAEMELKDMFYTVAAGMDFYICVVGMSDETGTCQNFHFEKITMPEPTKPAPVIEVSPLANPSGEEDPFEVWFNVKAPNADVVTAKYACNYDREFDAQLRINGSYSSLLETFGNLFAEDAVAQINSSEGLDLVFSSRDHAVTRLAVMGINDEGTTNGEQLDEEKSKAVAEQKTIVEPDAERVESSLFNDLAGEWTGKVKVLETRYDENWQQYDVETEYSFKVNIMNQVEIPAVLHDSVYSIYADYNNTREDVDRMYATFREEVEIYNRKQRGQNRLICLGLNFDNQMLKTVASPYDLFVSRTYNSYNEAAILYDFGPKWNLQIAAGDNVMVPLNNEKIYPVDQWQYYGTSVYLLGRGSEHYFGGYSDGSDAFFPVEVSSDKNTITLKAISLNGEDFLPSYGTISMTGANMVRVTEGIVLTRGWDDSSASAFPAKSSASAFFQAGSAFGNANITPAVRPSSRTMFYGTDVQPVQYKRIAPHFPSVQEFKENIIRKYSR